MVSPDYIAPGSAAYGWSGPYLGLGVGSTTLRGDDLSYGSGAAFGTGVAGSVYGGYNYQYNDWVFGIEGDLTLDSALVDDGDYLEPLDRRAAASVRGRIGYAFDNILPFLTAGLAVGVFRDDHDGGGVNLADKTALGVAIGAGLEVGLTENLVARAEYVFSNFGTQTFTFGGADDHEINLQTHDLRLGLAYKF